MLEGRHHELAHVPLVERPRAGRELVLQIEVLQPDLNELAERGVAGEFFRGDGARPLREHLLQVALGLLVGGTGGRDAADLAVVVAVASACADPGRPGLLPAVLGLRLSGVTEICGMGGDHMW